MVNDPKIKKWFPGKDQIQGKVRKMWYKDETDCVVVKKQTNKKKET